jgi:hypothetical protein
MFFSLDFNVDPSVASLWQELEDGTLYCFGETYLSPGVDIKQLAHILVTGEDRFGKRPEGCHWPENFNGLKYHQNRIYEYGDASGGARSMAADDQHSLWTQANDVFRANLGVRFVFNVPRANPGVYDSVQSVNDALTAGTVAMHPRCERLKMDLRSGKWTPGEFEGEEMTNTPLTHISDTKRIVVHPRPATKLTQRNIRNIDTYLRSNEFDKSPLRPIGRSPFR